MASMPLNGNLARDLKLWITGAVRIHHRGLAVASALVVLAVGVVVLIVFKIGQAQHLHHFVTVYHHLPRFARDLLGGGRLAPSGR